jgi:hypothetical protein
MGLVRFGATIALVVASVAVVCPVRAQQAPAQPPPAQEAAPQQAAPPPQGEPAGEPGIVSGIVVDKSSGDPLIDAGIEVVGANKTVRTDVDGKFKVSLPPGSYAIRVYAPFYQPVRLESVIVKSRETTKANASLAAAPGNVQVVEVVSQADRAAEATQINQRKKAAVVSDTVSAEVIKKTPGKDAAEVVKRVPAVTVKDDRFIFVRGLGERYASALLDGSRLPSPDPDRRVVPLDLFPADFIESLSVMKTYSPDLPGDFTAGVVDIRLREYPERFSLTANVGTTFNSQTSFQDFRTYEGSSLDFLGLGSDFRKIPESVPDTTDFVPLPQRIQNTFGRQFRNIWNTETDTAPPGTNFTLTTGNTFGDKDQFGITVAGVYTSDWQNIPDRVENEFVNGGVHEGATRVTHFTVDDSLFKTRLGGLMTGTWKLDEANKLFTRMLVEHNSFDDVTFANGTNKQGIRQQETVLRYTEEELDLGQLGGEHRWPWLWVDWRTAYSRTTQDEPDTRYITYEGDPLQFTTDSLGGSRIFNTLNEKLTDSAVDFTVPFSTWLPFTDFWNGLPAKFKFGPAYAYRQRNFEQRRFVYDVMAGLDLTQDPETILAPANQIPGLINFNENTQPGDSYDVSQEIIGGYGMFDLPLVRDHLRLVAGARVEYSYIRLNTLALGETGAQRVTKNNLDPLPAVNLIYTPIPDMNLRFGYSQTVSRPEFRELSPTEYPAPRGLRAHIGNPDLIEANIENWDLRWEWFFSPLELVSLSFFHKSFDNPIEQTVIEESSNVADSWKNAKDGTLTGFEFELRKNFGFVSPRLQGLSFITNVAYVDSTVHEPKAKTLEAQTNTTHAFQGQPPYIANAVIEWAHPTWGTYRLLYYTAGPVLSAVGAFGLPDIMEEQRNQLDMLVIVPIKPFDVPMSVKLSVENLLDDNYHFTQAGRTQRDYQKGVKVGLSFGYAFN